MPPSTSWRPSAPPPRRNPGAGGFSWCSMTRSRQRGTSPRPRSTGCRPSARRISASSAMWTATACITTAAPSAPTRPGPPSTSGPSRACRGSISPTRMPMRTAPPCGPSRPPARGHRLRGPGAGDAAAGRGGGHRGGGRLGVAVVMSTRAGSGLVPLTTRLRDEGILSADTLTPAEGKDPPGARPHRHAGPENAGGVLRALLTAIRPGPFVAASAAGRALVPIAPPSTWASNPFWTTPAPCSLPSIPPAPCSS